MDLRMPGVNGVAAIRGLAERQIPSRVLVLTTYDSDSDVVPAIEAGATGYLLKDSPRDELFRAVRAASRGESVLASSVATRLMSQLRDPAPDALSDRELEVLSLIAQGETNRGAAARLFISEATVKTHLLHIYAKLERQRPCRRRRHGLRARPAADEPELLTARPACRSVADHQPHRDVVAIVESLGRADHRLDRQDVATILRE